MIRRLQPSDLDTAANIWLTANLSAHDFISDEYWLSQFEPVKELLSQAELYGYEEGQKILGFVGLNGDYIAGLFVRSEARSRGVGKELLDFAKGVKPWLSLKVYQKNPRAISFYQREGFELRGESVDQKTGEQEYAMEWAR